MRTEYHVSINGCDTNIGTQEYPFRTISKAAEIMEAGDSVIVHEGVYREWIKPAHGGKSDLCRIIYEAASGEKVVIKGSEQVKNWEHVEGTVWKAEILNEVFGDWNPYAMSLHGDWFILPKEYQVHPGDVYLNGKSMYEAPSLEAVKQPEIRREGVACCWGRERGKLRYPEESKYQWYAIVNDEVTVIYANFHEFNPNHEDVEINVRQSCFYPNKTGIDYITVKGFEMAHAATLWAPPTSNQQGLIGPRWSKGWIIENNIIHDSKCMGISIGRDDFVQDECPSKHLRKSGHQYQLEGVFQAWNHGWKKENVGSHIIRNNTIYNCGQDGIGGNLGCIYSKITHNHIYNIGTKYEFYGHEIAGIKLHAAIDAEIEGNCIHDCTLGTWLDWQAQGVRVSNNIYFDNERDIMIEVTHGPHIVDNNIFASNYNLINVAQGGAYIHNLFCGRILLENELQRATPYHLSHSTDLGGYAFTYGGDDRFLNNMFVGKDDGERDGFDYGLSGFGDCSNSFDEYIERISDVTSGYGNTEGYFEVKQPVYTGGNVYFNGAKPFEREECVESSKNLTTHLVEENGKIYLEIDIPEEIMENTTQIVDTEKLGMVRIVEEIFCDRNGQEITFDKDYFGNVRSEKPVAGPFEIRESGKMRKLIWSVA